MSDLITEIYKDGRYKSICKQIAKRKEQAEELHSTFILRLLEMKEKQKQFLQSMKQDGTLEVYCIGIINNVWHDRNRVKCYEVGSTSPLFQYTSTFEIPHTYNEEEGISPEEFFSEPTDDYDDSIDHLSIKAREIIERDCDNPQVETMYKARVFKYSYIEFDNPDQFAKKVGIPRASVRHTCYQYRHYLNEEIKKIKE